MARWKATSDAISALKKEEDSLRVQIRAAERYDLVKVAQLKYGHEYSAIAKPKKLYC